jgi:DNA repair photolyase
MTAVGSSWHRGRGSDRDPGNRFERTRHVIDEELDPAQEPAPGTVFIPDQSRTIISRNDSPDIPYSAGLNPYRGCEHGCSYCYARPYHEYLAMSPGLDFESRILVKHDAAALLREELSSLKWVPQVIGMSGVTDCYQPAERRFGITRACLAVLAEFRNPVGIITKNALVTRDLDHLHELAQHQAVSVCLSVTTLDAELGRKLEPRASTPAARLAAVRRLREAGVPVGINIAPVIPGLNDHEIPAILDAAAAAGAQNAGYGMVRLPHAVKDLFTAWLREHVPTHADKVLHGIAAAHGASLSSGGSLAGSEFFTRKTGSSPMAGQIGQLFAVARRKAGLDRPWPELSTAAFLPPQGRQTSLFDG